MRFGPSTDAVEHTLRHARSVTAEQKKALAVAYDRTHGTGVHDRLWMSRDLAWHRLLQAVTAHDQPARFKDLWNHIGRTLGRAEWTYAATDAICATFLSHALDEAGFSTADHDTLLAPWRLVADGCGRSRLYLELAPRHPHPGETLWPIVDAVLTQETR